MRLDSFWAISPQAADIGKANVAALSLAGGRVLYAVQLARHRADFAGRRHPDRKAHAARGPYPFTPHPIGDVSKQDLAGNTEQTDGAQCPDGHARAEADVEQIFGLVNLHRVPDVQSAEIAERYPPEPRGA